VGVDSTGARRRGGRPFVVLAEILDSQISTDAILIEG
jgi:hypothetical protein